MQPTIELEHALANLELRQAEGKPSFVRWDRMLEQARESVQKGRLRDLIQSERPEGCTCLGTGERIGVGAEGEKRILGSCSCAEGVERKERLQRERDEQVRRDAAFFLDRAGIPPFFTNFTLEAYPGKVPDEIKNWRWSPKGLFIHGEYGTGKTGLAVGVLKWWISHGNPGTFVTVPAILDEIRATYSQPGESEAKLTDRVMNAQTLVMDDIGAERPTEWVVEKLFTLINHRHDHELATIFTSNLSISQLAERLGERTTWRIVEMSEVVHLKGPNLRAKK